MKLACDIAINNRLKTSSSLKYAKSTLALCKAGNSQYCFIMFHSTDKSGTKYELRHIKKILKRFVAEGKVTFQFKTPPHDLYIKADQLLLKNFLIVVKRAIQNVLTKKDTDSIVPVEMVVPAKPVLTKLCIQNSVHYPCKGFPRTLIELRLNFLHRYSLDEDILCLSKLQILDVSNNYIKNLPVEINELPNLCELRISHNQLGEGLISPKDWNWIGGNLSKTLRLLDVSNNSLKFIPQTIIKLQALITLNINFNCLTSLPPALGCLPNLRTLNACDNLITLLPTTAKNWRLHTLDVSHNKFQQYETLDMDSKYPKFLPVWPLKEYASRQVLLYKLPYSPATLPKTVINFMDSAKYCVCGKPCFSVYVRRPRMLAMFTVTKNFCIAANEEISLPMDCFFCSISCVNANRIRPPIVR